MLLVVRHLLLEAMHLLLVASCSHLKHIGSLPSGEDPPHRELGDAGAEAVGLTLPQSQLLHLDLADNGVLERDEPSEL